MASSRAVIPPLELIIGDYKSLPTLTEVDAAGDLVLVMGNKSLNLLPSSSAVSKLCDNGQSMTISRSESRNEVIKIRVASGIVRHISPVIRELLNEKSKTGHDAPRHEFMEIHLGDENVLGLLVLLLMAHYRFDDVPSHMTPSLMLQIWRAKNRFKVIDIIPCWRLIFWIQKIKKYEPVGWNEECASWLSMYHDLHLKEELAQLSKSMICRADMMLELKSEEGARPVIEHIMKSRTNGLERAFASLSSMISFYEDISVRCCSNDSQACDRYMRGAIAEELDRHALWPVPSAPYDSWSFDKLESALSDMNLESLCTIAKAKLPEQYWKDRVDCDFNLATADLENKQAIKVRKPTAVIHEVIKILKASAKDGVASMPL